MRRGLISWSRAELPETVLDARIAAVQEALMQAGLDALVVYTTPARAACVSWLAGFVPYWNQGLLVVPAAGRPILVSALSNRVADWLQLNAHVSAVRNSPRIGAEAAAHIAATKANASVGIVDMPALPASIIAELTSGGHVASDATALVARLRTSPDAADLSLHARAANLARQALDQDLSDVQDAGEAIAAIELSARRGGAEEVYPALACDLSRSCTLVRVEGAAKLGTAFAIRTSLSYKGAWVRLTRTIDRSPQSAARQERAAIAFAAAVTALPDTRPLAAFRSWLVEATRTTMPLEPLAGTVVADPVPVGPGEIVNVQAAIEIDAAPVLLGGPAWIGANGSPSSLLVSPL